MSMRLCALALLPVLLSGCASGGLGGNGADRVMGGSLDATPTDGVAGPSGPDSSAGGPATVRCEDLPHLWSGAHDIAYDPQTRVVRFGWADGTAAEVLDTAPGCAAQPGLAEQLAGHRDGADAGARASCQELRHLVDAVRSERRASGQSTSGSVPVSEAAQAAAAATSGVPARDAATKPGSGQRMIDLDESDEVLEHCPG